MNSTATVTSVRLPSVAWPRPCAAGASVVSLAKADVYPLAVSGSGNAKHSQKRFTMTGTDIDGWPLGPGDGKSG
jgi:hypothetical protein